MEAHIYVLVMEHLLVHILGHIWEIREAEKLELLYMIFYINSVPS